MAKTAPASMRAVALEPSSEVRSRWMMIKFTAFCAWAGWAGWPVAENLELVNAASATR